MNEEKSQNGKYFQPFEHIELIEPLKPRLPLKQKTASIIWGGFLIFLNTIFGIRLSDCLKRVKDHLVLFS